MTPNKKMSVLIDRVLFNNDLYQKLTPWERDFFRSLAAIYQKSRSFTPKQKNAAHKILEQRIGAPNLEDWVNKSKA